ncbi:MAG: hypothetical protein QXG44_08370 [Candidatus Jordarchaeaceae archaeon]
MERRHPLPQMRLNTAEGAWKLWRGSQKVQVQNVWENLKRQGWNPIPLFSAEPEGMVHAHPPLPGPAQLHPQPKLAPGPKLHDHL